MTPTEAYKARIAYLETEIRELRAAIQRHHAMCQKWNDQIIRIRESVAKMNAERQQSKP